MELEALCGTGRGERVWCRGLELESGREDIELRICTAKTNFFASNLIGCEFVQSCFPRVGAKPS